MHEGVTTPDWAVAYLTIDMLATRVADFFQEPINLRREAKKKILTSLG